jgi:hypothetical protein
MNTPRTMAAVGRQVAVVWPGCQHVGGAWRAMGLGLALSGAGFLESRAQEVVRPVATPKATSIVPVVSVPAIATPVAVVAGTITNQSPSISVPLGDPVMAQPAVEVLQEMATRDRSELINRGTQEALDERTKDSLRPLTVEEAGSPLRQVARDRSLRALADLFDPFAPLPKHYRDVAPAFDEQHRLEQDLPSSLRSNGGVTRPRTSIDPATHEYGWSLFRFSSKTEQEREERIRERRKRR